MLKRHTSKIYETKLKQAPSSLKSTKYSIRTPLKPQKHFFFPHMQRCWRKIQCVFLQAWNEPVQHEA